MTAKASEVSAAIAGAWAVLGMIPFARWMEHHTASSVLWNHLLWLSAIAVFVFIPVYFFVLGKENQPPFRRTWFLDRDERARYGVIVKRGLIWFLSAGAVSAVWSVVLRLVT